MKTKINKMGLRSLLGIFAIAIFAAVAWTLVASNASAVEDEAEYCNSPNSEIITEGEYAAEEQQNTTYQISFNIQGLDEGDTPSFQLLNHKDPVLYNLGDKITFEGSKSEVSYDTDGSWIAVYNEDDGFVFTATNIGYEVDSFGPSPFPKTIDNNYDFVINLKKSEKPYTIYLNVWDVGSSPIENANVKLVDTNFNLLAGPVSTNEYGEAEFVDLSASKATGILVINHADYCDYNEVVTDQDYFGEHSASKYVRLPGLSEADTILSSDDPLLKHFDVEIQRIEEPYPPVIQCYQSNTLHLWFDFLRQYTNVTIDEDGIVNLSQVGEKVSNTMTISPTCETGYVIKHWLVDTGNNEYKPVEPGESFTIKATESAKFDAKPVFEKAPEPIEPFIVRGQVIDENSGNPVPNATVGFYNSDLDIDLDEPLVSTASDENGYYVLDGCSLGEEKAEVLKLSCSAKHYVNILANYEFEPTDIIDGVAEVDIELDPAMIDLYCDGPEHQFFTVVMTKQEVGKDPEIMYSKNLEFVGIGGGYSYSNEEMEMIMNVEDGGVLVSNQIGEDVTETITIIPTAAEGYTFDNYLVNNKTQYRAGDSIDLIKTLEEEEIVKMYVNYIPNGEGGGDIAQTGDTIAYAVFALAFIAIASGAVYVLRRRRQEFKI